uniref:Beta-microseminoprotein n=1 Tax=Amazona collaria TaxID=241587 RepID=A0A8B9FXV4_9PSIT
MGITVTLGDAYCFSKINKPGETKGCVLDGKLYPYGEIARTENCLRCSCSKREINCCSLFLTPIGYDKENLVQKSDPTKHCTNYSRVG